MDGRGEGLPQTILDTFAHLQRTFEQARCIMSERVIIENIDAMRLSQTVDLFNALANEAQSISNLALSELNRRAEAEQDRLQVKMEF